MKKRDFRPTSKLSWPLFLVGLLVAIGSYWSFQRGGHDFDVFYHAWFLVIHGFGSQIYVNSPDRFLYAPGFAWLLAPVGLLPEHLALGLWDLAKAAAVYWMVQAFADRISSKSALAIAAGGVILCARPFLIEFQYGQVNTFILATCCWAIFSYFDGEKTPKARRTSLILAWFTLGLIASSKIFALPLLLFPCFRRSRGIARTAVTASLCGVAAALFLPILTLGFAQGFHMLSGWMGALAGKGLPLETHNQSFAALIWHYFTSSPTHVIALGPHWIVLGQPILDPSRLSDLALAWSFLSGSFLLGWIFHSQKTDPLRWTAVTIGLLFVPSYLVWKPYFVLTYPLAVLMLWRYRKKAWLIVFGFLAMNFSGFNWMGPEIAARLEAASIFLLVHLAYLACVIWESPASPYIKRPGFPLNRPELSQLLQARAET